jgi:hypothetical protein
MSAMKCGDFRVGRATLFVVLSALTYLGCPGLIPEEFNRTGFAIATDAGNNASVTANCPMTQNVAGTWSNMVPGGYYYYCIPNAPLSCPGDLYVQALNDMSTTGTPGGPCTYQACCYSLDAGSDAGDAGDASDTGADADADAGGGCNATTCPNGCCDQYGLCRPGTGNYECGTGGARCASCFTGYPGGSQFCSNQACAACNPTTCPNGCCTLGACIPVTKQNYQQCGNNDSGGGGLVCIACDIRDPSSGCVNGRCQACNATTCPNGCCDTRGDCVSPNWEKCGTGGAACVKCALEETCSNGQCRACNATNCPNGCCGRFGCEAGNERIFCGRDGNACQECTDGQTCFNQQCQACNATTCPNGCCSEYGCLSGTSTSACGKGGAACTTCAEGKDCLGQQCQQCNATTCPNGCCSVGGTGFIPEPPIGICVDGTGLQCGNGGAACELCALGQQCIQQSCGGAQSDAGLE